MKAFLALLTNIVICSALAGQTKSAEFIGSSGGTQQNEKIMCSYSIGEISIETIKNNQLTITQGFQQPYSPLFATNVKDKTEKEGKWVLYPNPTINILNIDYSQDLKKEVTIKIYDLQGNCCISTTSQQNKTQLNLSSLTTGHYFVSIFTSNGNLISSYKINKN